MKRKLLTLFLIGISLPAFCQKPVVVEYDFLDRTKTRIGYLNEQNDTVFKTRRPFKVKNNTAVKFHFVNYNAEVLSVEAKAKRGANSDSLSKTNFVNFFSTLGSLVAPGIDIAKFLPKRGPAKVAELRQLRPDLNRVSAFKYEEDIIVLDTVIGEKLRQLNRWKTVAKDLKTLRENTKYTKKQTKEKVEALLASLSPDAPSVLVDEGSSTILIRQIAKENATYLNKALEAFSAKIDNQPVGRGVAVISEYDLAKDNRKIYREYINETTELDIQKTLGDISGNYQAVLKNNFEADLNTFLDGNTEHITLNFYQKRQAPEQGTSLVRAEQIQISSSRGIHVTTSFGISVSKFVNDLESYFVKDQVVVASKGDKVVPSFSLYIQMSSKSVASFKIGGHFGVGVPLIEAKSVNFQVGPSLIFGSKNMVCLNLGIITGKATRLSGGWNVGDKYTATVPLPTQNRYELGYHVGVSFDIAQLFGK